MAKKTPNINVNDADTKTRINDYLNNRPIPTTVDGEEKTEVGGKFSFTDNRYPDMTKCDAKAVQLQRSVIARKLRNERLPDDPIEAGERVAREFRNESHISDAGAVAEEAFSRCLEFVALADNK